MTRAFLDRPLRSEVVEGLCLAALQGPSAGNTRSVEVLCLQGAEVSTYWETSLTGDRRARFPWPGLLNAPVLLIPYVRPSAYVERYGEPDKAHTGLGDGGEAWSVPYWWVDGGAAAQNVLLWAEAAQLGACLFGQFEHESAIRTRFGVPDSFRAIATIAVGHRDEDNDRRSQSTQRAARLRSERIHHGVWEESASR